MKEEGTGGLVRNRKGNHTTLGYTNNCPDCDERVCIVTKNHYQAALDRLDISEDEARVKMTTS